MITTKAKKGKSEETTTGNDRTCERGEDLSEGSLSVGSSSVSDYGAGVCNRKKRLRREEGIVVGNDWKDNL